MPMPQSQDALLEVKPLSPGQFVLYAFSIISGVCIGVVGGYILALMTGLIRITC